MKSEPLAGFRSGRPVVARYAPAAIPSHQGNPLIEALPPIKSDDEWLVQLLSLPAFDPNVRELPSHLRSYHVAELKLAFNPTIEHLALSRRFDEVLREGYRHRSVAGPQRIQQLQAQYDALQSGQGGQIRFAPTQPICSFSLLGISGSGKTTAVESILGSYPRYVFHPRFDVHQVVYVKVECPRDGSVRDLALNIIRAFEDTLGKRLVYDARRGSASSFLAVAKHAATLYCLGALVIDELQNLTTKRTEGREELLNFLQEVVNELRIPVVLLGTPKAGRLLSEALAYSRRGSIRGSFSWGPMALDEEFRALVEFIWGYQWVLHPVELTDDIVRTIHEETQGVRSLVVDMFIVAQLQAMLEDETVTPDLFKRVARRQFALVQPMLNALRSKDPSRLARFSDITTHDIDEVLAQQRLLVTRSAAPQASNTSTPTTLVALAASRLRSSFDLTAAQARAIVDEVNNGGFASAKALTMAAAKRFVEKVDGPTAGDVDAL